MDNVFVEPLGKALQIDIGRIKNFAKISKRARVDESIGMGHIKKPFLLHEKANIEHVFIEDRGFNVSVSNGARPYLFCLFYDHLRRYLVAIDVLWRGLGDLPVLAELALEIASGGGQGIGGGTREDMEKRFLLNRVWMKSTGIPVDQAEIFSVPVFPHPANPSFTPGNTASMRAELTLDFSSTQ
jgi:hypothetical protein